MRRARGFSLVEILVAMMILTLVITVSLAAFVERNRRLKQASDIILAYQALANEAEYQRRIDFDALGTSSRFVTTPTQLLRPLQPWTATVAVAETQTGIKNVLLTIRWNNDQREAQLQLVRVRTGGDNLW